jgi:hypothetical protein
MGRRFKKNKKGRSNNNTDVVGGNGKKNSNQGKTNNKWASGDTPDYDYVKTIVEQGNVQFE